MAKFKVENVFYLDSVKAIFFVGEITNGKINTTMTFKIEGISMKISSIEFVDGKLNNKLISKIALKIFSDRSLYEKIIEKPITGIELDLVGNI